MPLSIAQLKTTQPEKRQLAEAITTLEYALRCLDGHGPQRIELSELLAYHGSLFGDKLKEVFWAIGVRESLETEELYPPPVPQIQKAAKYLIWATLKVVPKLDDAVAEKLVGNADHPQAIAAQAMQRAQSGPSNSRFTGQKRAPLGTTGLERLLRRAGMSLRAGVDARKVWEQEAERASGRHQAALDVLFQSICRGESLAGAMRTTGGYFPGLACELVEVGEQAGKLEETLIQLADHYKHLINLRRTLLIGIFWPSIQLFAAVCIIGLFIFIIGMIGTGPGQATGVFGLSGGTGVLVYFVVVGFAAALLVAFIMGVLRNWFGSLPMRVLYRIPFVGGCLRNMALARLTWALALSLNAGIDAIKGMSLALQATQNHHFIAQIPMISQILQSGQQFHEAIRATKVFPREFEDRLENAELSGTHSESLLRMSDEYRDKAQDASRMLTMVASFGIWVLVGLLIIGMIFYIFVNFILGTYYDAMQPI